MSLQGYYLKAELLECQLCHHTVPMRPYVHNGKTLRPTICIECSYLWDIANCSLGEQRQRMAEEFADYDGHKTPKEIIAKAFAKHPDLAGAKLASKAARSPDSLNVRNPSND